MKLKRTTTYSTASLPVTGSEISYDSLNDYLSALDDKIESAKKTVDFWDLYGIYSDFSGKSWDELQVAIAALPNNKSLIINTSTPISSGTKNYTRGDIVYKTETGEVKTVDSVSSGFYYPDSYSSGTITYKYATSGTEDKELSVSTASSTYMYAKNISFYKDTTSSTFKAEKVNNEIVKPVVKFFYQNEPIYLDYSLTITNEVYTITVASNVEWFTSTDPVVCVVR